MRKKSKGGGEPIETWDGIFADPEVGRVLHANGLIANANKSSIEELATITSLNPSGGGSTSYFYNSRVLTKFPELKYCTNLTNMYGAFRNSFNLTEVGNIPEGVTDMTYTFQGCSKLINAPVIPDSVTALYWTFADCTSLVSAPIIPSSVTDMRGTFYGCTSLDGIFIIKPLDPPTYRSTFGNTNVARIYVPDESVNTYKTTSGWSEFADKIYPMSEKDAIYFADPEVGRVLHANGVIANAEKSSIKELATITSLNPGGGSNTGYFGGNKVITKFPELKYCTGLSELDYAFRDCSNLTEVGNIPEGVTEMYRAFYRCSSLTEAPIISNSITSMRQTFRDCTRLNGIFIIKPVTPPAYNLTFDKVKVVAIYVPDESVDTYKTASNWSAHSSKIKPMSQLPK